jgi:ABC-2 type transport system ATP-binding protein
MTGPAIVARGLTKRFGDFTAVHDVALEVARGSIFAFLGANGSGKSTTIRMLIGLLQPSAGSAFVDGVDVIREPRRVRDRIGYMGQRVSLYAGLTLRENVEFYAGLHGLAGAELEARWARMRERFELAAAEGERPEDLPAGIRQRAGLALAMLHQPPILFLDEPTAGVDVASRGLFWERIQEEAESGVTVFVTTHFLEEVDHCDWVCFLESGRLVADAAPEELRRRFSAGYRVHLAPARGAPQPGWAEGVRAALAGAGLAAETASDGLVLQLPALGEPVFAALRRVQREQEAGQGARVRIEPPAMTDVFRRILAGAAP